MTVSNMVTAVATVCTGCGKPIVMPAPVVVYPAGSTVAEPGTYHDECAP